MNDSKIFKTNIEGLDELLHGGIVIPSQVIEQKRGLVILIKGAPGSGKTTLSCQLACSFFKEKSVNNTANNGLLYYYTLDQTKKDIYEKIYKLFVNNNLYKDDLKLGGKTLEDHELALFRELWDICRFFSDLLNNFLSFKNYKKLRKLLSNRNIQKSINDTQGDIYSIVKNVYIPSNPTPQQKDILQQLVFVNRKLNSTVLINQNIDSILRKLKDFFDPPISDQQKVVYEIKELLPTLHILVALKDMVEVLNKLPVCKKNTAPQKIFSFFYALSKQSNPPNNTTNQASVFKSLLEQCLGITNNITWISFITDFLVYSTQPDKTDDIIHPTPRLPLNSALSMLNTIPENKDAYITIIDGINSLTNEESSYFNFQSLIKFLRKKSTISFIVYDPNNNDSDFIDYMADMIIELQTEKSKYPIKYDKLTLFIPKSRYQNAIRGSQHQYKIRKYGLVIFPYLHYYSTTERTGSDETDQPHLDIALEKSKDSMNHNAYCPDRIQVVRESSLIDKIMNGVIPGSVTALIGARHTSKTSLSMDFLKSKLTVDTVKKTESRLLVSIIDNAATIINERDCLRQDCDDFNNCFCYKKNENIHVPKKPKCFDNIHLYQFQPLVISSNELLYQVDRRIKHSAQECVPITRLAFLDLTQLEYRFPNIVEDPYFLPSLLDYLRSSKYSIEIEIKSDTPDSKQFKVTRKYNNMRLDDNENKCLEGANGQRITKKDKTYAFNIHSSKSENKLIISSSDLSDSGKTTSKITVSLSKNSAPTIDQNNNHNNGFIKSLHDSIKKAIDISQNEKSKLLMSNPFDSGFIYVKLNKDGNMVIVIEYKINSIFMVSGAAILTKPISVLADNVIFLWRDVKTKNEKEKEKEGHLCLYLDRSAGDIKVDSNRFYAFPTSDKKQANPFFNSKKEINKGEKADDYKYAKNEIKKIISLQAVTKSLFHHDG